MTKKLKKIQTLVEIYRFLIVLLGCIAERLDLFLKTKVRKIMCLREPYGTLREPECRASCLR